MGLDSAAGVSYITPHESVMPISRFCYFPESWNRYINRNSKISVYFYTLHSDEDIMDINTLIHAGRKPAIYTPGTAFMWTDPHISKQLLDVHLNQDTDLASRKHDTIDTTIRWILGQADTTPLDILDLGCGPGLYTKRLAKQGHGVTGMDISDNSIRYANNNHSGLNITYIHQDYLTLNEKNRWDLIMMIFTDLGVLFPGQREELISRVYRALQPGGVFIFDVMNPRWFRNQVPARSWEASPGGFWKDHPYLALSESFIYEDESVVLNQHMVIDDRGGAEIYRFYAHSFSHDDLNTMMLPYGFKTIRFKEGLLPTSDLYESDHVTFCTAVK